MQRVKEITVPFVQASNPKDIDFASLGFQYTQTRSFVMYSYANGCWDKGVLVENPNIPTHIATQAFHYGQAVFEGLKAFRMESGQISCFRPQENAKRLIQSCDRLVMQSPTVEMFMEGVDTLIKDNIDYVPSAPGSLYIRPFVFGSSAQLGVAPSKEYKFILFCAPVGAYYKGGLTGVSTRVVTDFDRAATRGTGMCKCAGNYAASLLPHMQSLKVGYPVELYLDAKTNSLVEEFATSNFFGIKKQGDKIIYCTPQSQSVLQSITNLTLREIAEKMLGWTISREDIYINQVDQFEEVGACGTAVVCVPIKEIVYQDKVFTFKVVGEHTQKLYDMMTGIQSGKVEDKFAWNHIIQ
ncbi:Branched-chain amino acid aminotransferase [Spironucleus salmonicida]|uniref:Branched-chain amino acid aminotransferase n=1 Tax=Spironucleus salmonicida TaxID=348837 RepID=V6LKZ7_9EUKA|nr:Branched-chain amino acid aminotransferase [Spironucleus salmonicida]|eukprot:EST41354.1 Branched-chain amino acid aminotransferase [Spironucleus salmonicida]